jgi:hypothetical protein
VASEPDSGDQRHLPFGAPAGAAQQPAVAYGRGPSRSDRPQTKRRRAGSARGRR